MVLGAVSQHGTPNVIKRLTREITTLPFLVWQIQQGNLSILFLNHYIL